MTSTFGAVDMTDDIGIHGIGVALGSTRLENIARGPSLGREESFVERRIGFSNVYRETGDDPALQLAARAVQDLQLKSDFDPTQIDLVIAVGQASPRSRIPHLAAVLHGRLGLSRQCQTLDIGLGCSGWVHALVVAKSLMASCGLRQALVVTADPYSLVLDPSDDTTELIFSDGASATLLTRSGRIRIRASDIGTDGSREGALAVDDTGALRMDGRAVLDFAIKNVPGSVDRAVSASGLVPSQIGEVLLHQGSRTVVEMLASRLSDYPRPRFLSADEGNTVSSTLPLIIDRHGLSNRFTVASGFGVGLTWATVVLECLEDGNAD